MLLQKYLPYQKMATSGLVLSNISSSFLQHSKPNKKLNQKNTMLKRNGYNKEPALWLFKKNISFIIYNQTSILLHHLKKNHS